MVRITTLICDRCKKSFTVWDQMLQDSINKDYPGLDICPNCDMSIGILAKCAEGDALNNLKSGTTLKQWAELYGIKVGE